MRSGTWQLWNQKLEGGQAVQITQGGGFTAFESYDGKSLYYSKVDGEGIWTVPLRGGVETRITAAPRLGYWGAWAVSEAGIYLMEIDLLPHPGIEFYNFKTRKLTPVIKLDHEPGPWSPNMDTSRDGRIVVFSQGGNSQSSLAMVENVQ
jgi:hypothetical protein